MVYIRTYCTKRQYVPAVTAYESRYQKRILSQTVLSTHQVLQCVPIWVCSICLVNALSAHVTVNLSTRVIVGGIESLICNIRSKSQRNLKKGVRIPPTPTIYKHYFLQPFRTAFGQCSCIVFIYGTQQTSLRRLESTRNRLVTTGMFRPAYRQN